VKRVRRELLAWYRAERRDLPWRRTRDPYAIWISETMLQQTRVETVIPYYERFLARFPDVQALADAEPDELMRHWAGLGYYSRARNLHAAAKTVAERHQGQLPEDVEGLHALKGIGRYTAGAVASIAFDRPEPIVDGNVARVICRLLEIRGDVRGPEVQRQLWDTAAELAKGPSPGDLNQALMELGALVCTPRAPRCGACPLARGCAGYAAGDPETLPFKSPSNKPRRVEAVAAWITRGPRVLLVRRPPEGLLGGLWELPGDDLAKGEPLAAGLSRAMQQRVGLQLAGVRRVGEVRHVFTHRVLKLHVFRAQAGAGRVRRSVFDAHRWVSPRTLGALPLSAVAKKALAVANDA
jgi:A/G-specific adenine glycosylase